MIFIQSPSLDARFNLALEQYMFDKMNRDKDYFMLWQNKNAIVVGKHQNTFAEVNQSMVEKHNTTVVRRLSGGGAVYHDLGNLNFTFIINKADAHCLDILLFCEPIRTLLKTLNIDANITGRNDIQIGDKKFSGNAQYIKDGRVMHHGTIMFNSDLDMVAAMLNVAGDKYLSRAISSVRSRVTNVSEYLEEKITVQQFADMVQKFIAKDAPSYTLSKKDLKEIEDIKSKRYDLWEWNYGEMGDYSVVKERRVENVGKIYAYIKLEAGVISSIDFKGDYFATEDSSKLQNLLIGSRLERGELYEALRDLDCGLYFHNLKNQDLIDILVS